jgi:thiol-disulfide isomerase/thioredoxin
MMSSRLRFIGLLLAVLSLVAAACGDSDEAGSTTAPPGTTDEGAAGATTTSTPATTAAPSTTTTTPVVLETAPVAITGDPLPVVADSGADAAVGLTPPQVVGVDFGANEVVLAGGDGPQAIMFVSHWCPHCQDEVPAVQEWLDATGGVDGVEVVAVSTAVVPERPNYPPSEWFAAEAWSSPVMADDADASSFIAYGGRAIPFWVFVDADGKVFDRIEGGVDLGTLEAVMNDLAASG